ncbi:MAG TPA: MlaD family protein, partial [Chitinophagales bacterium]|nr:MlaD family protein [Chitinophagales bacterium]
MKFNNEVKVGALAIGAIVILLLGVNYLKGINLFNKGADYYVEYSHIPGLMKGDAIQINGYPIGRVKDIGIADVHSGIIFVVLNITEPIKVPSDSKATIRSADLLGEKFIALKLGASEVYLNPGDT